MSIQISPANERKALLSSAHSRGLCPNGEHKLEERKRKLWQCIHQPRSVKTKLRNLLTKNAVYLKTMLHFFLAPHPVIFSFQNVFSSYILVRFLTSCVQYIWHEFDSITNSSYKRSSQASFFFVCFHQVCHVKKKIKT